jgi:hypothetical protein
MKTSLIAIAVAASAFLGGWLGHASLRPSMTLVLHESANLSHASLEPWSGSAVRVDGDYVYVSNVDLSVPANVEAFRKK